MNGIPRNYWRDVILWVCLTRSVLYVLHLVSRNYTILYWSTRLLVSIADLAAYFEKCLSAHDLDEMNIEIIRNTLYKTYLEDFYNFCQSLDDPTAEIMGDILRVFLINKFEADRRVINITINSFNTELSKDDRSKLYPTIGKLFPDGVSRLARTDDPDQVRAIIETYPVCYFN